MGLANSLTCCANKFGLCNAWWCRYGNYGVIATSGSESGKNVIDYFEELVHAGMPHHVCIVRGHHATTLKSFVRCIGSIKSVM